MNSTLIIREGPDSRRPGVFGHSLRQAASWVVGATRRAVPSLAILLASQVAITGSAYLLASQLVEQQITSVQHYHGDSLAPEARAALRNLSSSKRIMFAFDSDGRVSAPQKEANPEAISWSSEVAEVIKRDVAARASQIARTTLGGFKLSEETTGSVTAPVLSSSQVRQLQAAADRGQGAGAARALLAAIPTRAVEVPTTAPGYAPTPIPTIPFTTFGNPRSGGSPTPLPTNSGSRGN